MPNSEELQQMADQRAEQARVDADEARRAVQAARQKADNSKNKK
jgi:hypothetical protein